ncbi:hypothetical protein MTR_4g088145 [Medicago truncatula]|uniref:Uncharacterized protein n=1 Tax=Medicago truncatula TaxID=3880 RepID=A0A072UYM7_MEDTR|nr:hypothetical protein MTR_4g088145 [Medicago truncatula]
MPLTVVYYRSANYGSTNVIIENVNDDLAETKPRFVDYSVEIKSPKVEVSVDVKPNTDDTLVYVEASVPTWCQRSVHNSFIFKSRYIER